jgi:hypothetical protein
MPGIAILFALPFFQVFREFSKSFLFSFLEASGHYPGK